MAPGALWLRYGRPADLFSSGYVCVLGSRGFFWPTRFCSLCVRVGWAAGWVPPTCLFWVFWGGWVSLRAEAAGTTAPVMHLLDLLSLSLSLSCLLFCLLWIILPLFRVSPRKTLAGANVHAWAAFAAGLPGCCVRLGGPSSLPP